MLIFTRRVGESFYIGDDVKVTVLGISGNQTRLGIKAPMDVAVDREEIYRKKQLENSRRVAAYVSNGNR